MRIVRFELMGRTGYGSLEGEQISVLWNTPYDGGLNNKVGEILSLPAVKLLAPCEPTQNCGPGAELPRPRRGVRPPHPGRAVDLPQACHRGDRPG